MLYTFDGLSAISSRHRPWYTSTVGRLSKAVSFLECGDLSPLSISKRADFAGQTHRKPKRWQVIALQISQPCQEPSYEP